MCQISSGQFLYGIPTGTAPKFSGPRWQSDRRVRTQGSGIPGPKTRTGNRLRPPVSGQVSRLPTGHPSGAGQKASWAKDSGQTPSSTSRAPSQTSKLKNLTREQKKWDHGRGSPYRGTRVGRFSGSGRKRPLSAITAPGHGTGRSSSRPRPLRRA